MESPTPGNKAGARGEVSAWRHDALPFSAIHCPVPHLAARPAGVLRRILTAAAEARRCGDHGAANAAELAALIQSRLMTTGAPARGAA
jgi:hypothetical protein